VPYKVEVKDPLNETYKVDAYRRVDITYKWLQEQHIILDLGHKQIDFDLQVRYGIAEMGDTSEQRPLIDVEVSCKKLAAHADKFVYVHVLTFSPEEWEALDKGQFLSILYRVTISGMNAGRKAGRNEIQSAIRRALGIDP
jgi:hypothetical protein